MPTYALTTATYERRALFQKPELAELLTQILFRYRDQGRYLLHGFAVMPDHLHALLSPASNQTIERCAQCIKGGFSFQARDRFAGEIWQPGFHEHRVRDEGDFAHQIAYIAANPELRHLENHAFVHTRFPGRLDPMPAQFPPRALGRARHSAPSAVGRGFIPATSASSGRPGIHPGNLAHHAVVRGFIPATSASSGRPGIHPGNLAHHAVGRGFIPGNLGIMR